MPKTKFISRIDDKFYVRKIVCILKPSTTLIIENTSIAYDHFSNSINLIMQAKRVTRKVEILIFLTELNSQLGDTECFYPRSTNKG